MDQKCKKRQIVEIILNMKQAVACLPNYICELRRIYNEMNHNDFMKIIKSVLMFFMQQPKDNTDCDAVLKCLCKFLASYKDDDNDNPCRSVFHFILTTDGANPYIQFRLCQLVNTLLFSLGKNADLDDEICEKILCYMFTRLKSGSPDVRAQAIYALERLQEPDVSNDRVTKYFIYHMEADPSTKVREAVISTIARNTKTIPIIMERLRDVADSVRRHTYIEMMKGFPVKLLRVEQRLTILENGLVDESQSIRKIVSHLMITEWLGSYNDDYILFLCALKLNGSDEQLQRYHKTMRIVLFEIFKKTKLDKLLTCFGCRQPDGSENEQIEHITLEHSIIWMNLAEYLYDQNPNDIDLLLPSLTTYCEYVTRYHSRLSDDECSINQWDRLENRHILTNLITNLKYGDYSDEVGKRNVIDFVHNVLKNWDINDYALEMLVKIMEIVVPETIDRFSMLNNILTDLYTVDSFEFLGDRLSIKNVLENGINSNVVLTLSEMKLNIMELTEQLEKLTYSKQYETAEDIIQKLYNSKMSYNTALSPFIKHLPEAEANSISLTVRKIEPPTVLKCLKIIFFTVSSERVSSLTPMFSTLYGDFIRRYTQSNMISIRQWAIQCGTSFALLHEPFAHDMFLELHKQIFFSPCSQIFQTLIPAIFQLVVRYGFEHFDSTRNSAYQVSHDSDVVSLSQDDYGNSVTSSSSDDVNWLSLMLHILDTCSDTKITNTIIEGFCLLCLNAKGLHTKIITKLIVKYFDPTTDSKINQLLGVFFEGLLARGKSFLLEPALLPTIIKILEAGPDCPLNRIKPKDVIRFVLKATKSQGSVSSLNVHDSIAESFLMEIKKNLYSKPRLVVVLSSELVKLRLTDSNEVKSKLLKTIQEILDDYYGEEKLKENLLNFQVLLSSGLKVTPEMSSQGAGESERDFRVHTYPTTIVYSTGDYLSPDEDNETINLVQSRSDINSNIEVGPELYSPVRCLNISENVMISNSLDTNRSSRTKNKSDLVHDRENRSIRSNGRNPAYQTRSYSLSGYTATPVVSVHHMRTRSMSNSTPQKTNCFCCE